MTTIRDLATYQFGKETTRGIAVPATAKMAIERVDFSPDEMIYRPRLARGIGARNVGNETPVHRATEWEIPESPVVYDDLQHFLGMSVAPVAAPTGTDPYVWTHARGLGADPACYAYTLERRLTDGASPIDNEWAYAMARSIGFRGAVDSPLRFVMAGFARHIQTSTLTPALTMPTVEIPPFALSKVYIDSAWANLGTTLISAQILGWSIDFVTGFIPLWTADARSDLDFTVYKWNPSIVALDVTIDALVGAQYAAEKTAAEAQTMRSVRIQVDGSNSRQIQFDMNLKHEEGSVFKIGEQDGQDIVQFKLVESADDGTNLFRVKLTNKTATLV